MSSAPTQLAVAPSASTLVTTTTQIKKDYLEEPPYTTCQNSLPPRPRGGVKGKPLTRSHAMRESASPPRTPTPRSSADGGGLASSPTSFSVSGATATHSHSSSSETINDYKVQVQSLSSSPLLTTSSFSTTTQTHDTATTPPLGSAHNNNNQQQQHLQTTTTTIMYSSTESNGVVCSQSQLDVDFPKLTPPKSSKGHRNHNNNNVSRDSSEKQQQHQLSQNSDSQSVKQQTVNNYGSGGMTTDLKGSNKNLDSDIGKMNHHNNKNNRGNLPPLNNNNAVSQNNGQSPPLQMKQTQSQQRRNNTMQQQQLQDQSQMQQNHQMQNDTNLVNSVNHLQISSPPPQTHHQMSHDKETLTTNNGNCNNNNNRYMRANDDSCSHPMGGGGGNQMNHCMNSSCNSAYGHDENRNNVICESPTDNTMNMSTNSKCDRQMGNKKHRNNNANAKGPKARLKNMGSSSSVEGGNSTSGFISRDSSTEQFTDSSGIDLKEFFRETLSKNPTDRSTLLEIERDLTDLVHDKNRNDIQYPAMSSYNRMLIHRVAAFFGMEHNVDSATPQCVIVSKTKQTRIPSIKFKSLYRASDLPRKSILKRDAYSFDERRNLHGCSDRAVLDRKAKSYEQREEEYEQARKRIFRPHDGSVDIHDWPPSQWCNNDSPEHSNRMNRHHKLLKVHSMSSESRSDGRPSVSKSHSFGGYGGPPPSGGPLTRGDSINSTRSAGARLFPKQDSIGSTNTPWRLSPSSSGSIYRFDPSNLPPSQAVAQGTYSNNKTSGVTSGHRKVVVDKPKLMRSDSHTSCASINMSNNTIANSNSSINTINAHDSMSSNGSGIVVGLPSQPENDTNPEEQLQELPESLEETVLVVDTGSGEQEIVDEENDENTTKDSHPHREMSDIQEETGSQSNEDKTVLSVDSLADTPDKPKLINQATSPNIPSPEPEPEPAVQSNENTKSASNSNPSQNSVHTPSVSSTPSTTAVQQTSTKKDDTSSSSKQSSATSSIPIMSFGPTGYQAIDGSTVFASPTNGPFPTAAAYQTGPDGSVYAVPQPMVYAYPPPMDGEFQGYFMPVYDQTQRDANGLVATAPAQAIYQPTGGPATTVVAYSTAAAYGGAPLYQGQVVYSPTDQFAAAASNGQLQQYPLPTYPVGYTYPYNGYWGQPAMTYYVPQPAPPPITSSIISQPLAGAAGGGISSTGHSSNSNSNPVNGTKRSTPPQNSISSGHNSQSVTPAAASTYQFAAAPPGLPLTALATQDPNGPPGATMYAIPQTATVFPSMLPYAPPAGTPSGVLSHHIAGPHPQPNAVINPIISTQAAAGLAGGPQIPLDASGTPSGGVISGYAITDRNGPHVGNASSGTPHSAPSTPLSNTIALPPHQVRNAPPLFATPSILPTNYNNHMPGGHYTHLDMQNGIINPYASAASNYERRNSNNKRNGTYMTSRQNSYTNNSNNQNGRKTNMNEYSNHASSSPSTTYNGNNRSSMYTQQKRINNGINVDKSQPSINNINSSNSAQNNNTTDKSRNSSIVNNSGSSTGNGGGASSNSSSNTSVIRTKPSNLDFRRSVSQRNSPSTNSIESNNNSPNSVASMNHMTAATHHASFEHTAPPMYMTRGTHIPQMHPPTAAALVSAVADACHQQFIGAAYNHSATAAPPPAGMYLKYGQTYFAHPPMALPNNRRTPPNDLRPQLAPFAGVYPTVNMMLSAPRTMPPRQPNPNYKGNKPSR